MKKQIIIIVSLLVLFLILLAAYFVAVKPLTVAEPDETAASVQTQAGEVVGANNRVQMFDYITSDKVESLFVHNKNGEYKFYRNGGGYMVIEGHEEAYYDQEKYSSMIVNAGYTLSMYSAAIDESDFEKYGLAEAQQPSYYILTSTAGDSHKVFIGDKIPSGAGYYARYDGRNSVYVLDSTISDNLLAPVEALIKPLLAYPSGVNTYYLVSPFVLYRGEEIFLQTKYLNEDERSELASMSVHRIVVPAEYGTSANFDNVLSQFTEFLGSKVVRLGVDDEGLEKYGLKNPAYSLYFSSAITNDKNEVTQMIDNFIVFSEKQKDESGEFYYAVSYLFDIIARVDAAKLEFLEWDLQNWVSSYVFGVNIANVSQIEFTYDGGHQTFLLTGEEKELVVTERESGHVPETGNFRQLWKTMLMITQDGLADLTEEQMAELKTSGKCLLKISVLTKSGVSVEYAFYPYSDRRCYYTVNGEGEFYVLRTSVEKTVSDIIRVMNDETVNPDDKY